MNFQDFLKEELERDPVFRREWEESEPASRIRRALVAARSRCHWTQAELARRMGTSQANISRAETTGEVSPEFLTRFAAVVGGEARLSIKLPGTRRMTLQLDVAIPAGKDQSQPTTAGSALKRSRNPVVFRMDAPTGKTASPVERCRGVAAVGRRVPAGESPHAPAVAH